FELDHQTDKTALDRTSYRRGAPASERPDPSLTSRNHREHQPTTRPETVQPFCRQVIDAGIDENGIRRPGIVTAAVALYDLDVRQVREVASRAVCKLRVNLDCRHASAWDDHMGEDRSVISGAASDVHHMISGLGCKLVD